MEITAEIAKVKKVFAVDRPIIGMIHLKGGGRTEVLETAKKEVHSLLANGVDAVLIENYFGSTDDVAAVLHYLKNETSDIIYGVNVLDDDALGFEFAKKYCAAFIQLDSVSGHLEPDDDEKFNDFIVSFREKTNTFVLGGVRFKYQPYKSGRSLEDDLLIATCRCDAIVVTGNCTGEVTPTDKIKSFREVLSVFPLFIGAGLTPENCSEQLPLADGAIVGSYFKGTFEDSGDVCAEHVRIFMDAAKRCK